jgi:hypothetical protein
MNHFAETYDLRATAWSSAAPAAAERATSAVIEHPLESGAVLVKRHATLPEGVYSAGTIADWNLLAARSPEFEERVRGSEWHWSYYVPSAVAHGWSPNRANAVQAATRRLLKQVDAAELNSIEVTSVTIRNVLGMKRATVRADLRNLQRGPFLRELDPWHRVRRTWHPRDLIRTRNRKGAEAKGI